MAAIDDLKERIKTLLISGLPPAIVAQKKKIVADKGGDRNWKSLSQLTVNRKGSDQPWVETGLTMSLMSASYQDNGDTMEFGIDENQLPEYATQVDQGARPGTGRFTANIPARPLLNYTAQDMQELTEVVKKLLQGGLTNAGTA